MGPRVAARPAGSARLACELSLRDGSAGIARFRLLLLPTEPGYPRNVKQPPALLAWLACLVGLAAGLVTLASPAARSARWSSRRAQFAWRWLRRTTLVVIWITGVWLALRYLGRAMNSGRLSGQQALAVLLVLLAWLYVRSPNRIRPPSIHGLLTEL